MDFTVTGILLALATSAVGFAYFRYGRKMTEPRFMACGVALMLYPYFVSTPWITIVIGIGIAAVPFTVWR